MGITSRDNYKTSYKLFPVLSFITFRLEKLHELRQKKRDFLHTIYDINVKTKAQISCAVIAELIHSFLVGYIAALERLIITPTDL